MGRPVPDSRMPLGLRVYFCVTVCVVLAFAAYGAGASPPTRIAAAWTDALAAVFIIARVLAG